MGLARTTSLLLILSAALAATPAAWRGNSQGRADARTFQQPVVVAAAGDIACHAGDRNYNGGNGSRTTCRMRATADLLLRIGPDAVLALGDLQYPAGALSDFRTAYASSWGRLRSITRPAPGNHEYATPRAAGYFAYFGSRAGSPRRGYYSFDLGAWHLVALNSNCPQLEGGCGRGSPQERWLRADLMAHRNRCVLAYWHHPRFSSGAGHGSDPRTAALFTTLYAARADVVLTGHEHSYERFHRQGPLGRPNRVRGIRTFVVGTGGHSLYRFAEPRRNSAVRQNTVFGVLELTLLPDRYSWRFVPEAGKSFVDRGSSTCH